MFCSIRQKFLLLGRTENRVLTNYENNNEESLTVVFWGSGGVEQYLVCYL